MGTLVRTILAAVVMVCALERASAGEAPVAKTGPPPSGTKDAATSAPQGSPAPPAAPCRFAGSWVLNANLSDDPAVAVPTEPVRRDGGGRPPDDGETGERRGYGGGGGRGGFGRHRGMGGREGSQGPSTSGERPSGSDERAMGAAMALMREMPATLIVAQSQDVLQIVEAGGRITSWKVDGKPHLDDRFGTAAQAEIRWDGETLREATPLGSGGEIDETYALVRLADGKQLLQVTRTLKAPRGPRAISVRRVYEPGS